MPAVSLSAVGKVKKNIDSEETMENQSSVQAVAATGTSGSTQDLRPPFSYEYSFFGSLAINRNQSYI